MSDIKLYAVGDIMLGDLPQCYGFGVGSYIDKMGVDFPFAHIVNELHKADVLIGNLEAVLSDYDRNTHPFKDTIIRGRPKAAQGLKNAGFSVLSLANNHIMQHGYSALIDTINALKTNEIAVTGIDLADASISNEHIMKIKGVTLGFLAYNMRPRQYIYAPPPYAEGNPGSMKSEIAKIKDKADLVIVSIHWGDEFINYPNADQVTLAHDLIDGGADIIIGHHPHILQAIEKYRHGIIAYSLGNFVFDMWQNRLRKSIILRIGIGDDLALSYDVVPIFINNEYQPQEYTQFDDNPIVNMYDNSTRRIKSDIEHRDYKSDLLLAYRRYRREVYWHYFTNMLNYNLMHLLKNALNAIQRRIVKCNYFFS